jgi:hypothetical protein
MPTPLGLPYPDPTGHVSLGANDIRSLAEAVDLLVRPLWAYIATEDSCASTTPVDAATVGPQITVARAGDYLVDAGAVGYANTAGASAGLWVKNGAAAAVQIALLYFQSVQYNGMRAYPMKITVVAGTVVKLQYSVSVGAALFRNRSLILQPV